IAGELWPSDSQADVSTNYVNQASEVPLWEEPPPSPAPKGPLQAVPSCNTAEVTSATESWHDDVITDAEVPSYIEQFPQKIIIPFVDQTAYLLTIEQQLNAGQGWSVTTLGGSAGDLVHHPDRTESSTAQVASAEQVCLVR
ncbi:hypothetical protein N320_04961, partial [Buceros rhinoceros silvestris]